MNIKEIKELVKMLDGTDVTEISLENEGSRVVIKKGVAGATHYIPQAAALPFPFVGPNVLPNHQLPSPQAAPIIEEKNEGLGPNQVLIVAPMVGTFYRAPSPEAEPYVQVGQTVEVGQVVCIIEAMKLMNEIESEWRGKIVQMVTENAQPVEFGQPLFVLEKI
jgi:acetyl-CoA carboxylase biotin carboxyl carrier protein